MADPKKQLLTVVMPAHNEQETIGQVLEDLLKICGDILHEIIVVDDGSTDLTSEIAAQFTDIRVIRHRQNQGYGAALKTGIRAAQTDYILMMDSDGQHRPEDVSCLYQLMDESDMVVGQRTGIHHSPLWRLPGKWLLFRLANYITRRQIPDLNSGFRIIRRDVVLRYMHLCPSGYSFSTTITMALLTQGYTVNYVPIQANSRNGKSLVSISTGFETLVLIVRIAALFNPLRVFIPTSLITITVGVLWEIPYALMGRGVSVGSMLAIVTGVLLFWLGIICDQMSQLRLERYDSSQLPLERYESPRLRLGLERYESPRLRLDLERYESSQLRLER